MIEVLYNNPYEKVCFRKIKWGVESAMEGYIKDIRNAVGSMPIILNFACICVLNDKGDVLLQARDAECTKWGFPGGALEHGESYTEAAIRECREETGYEVVIDSCLGIFDKYFASYPNGDAQTIVVAYTGHVTSGKVTIDNNETHDLRWFPVHDVPALFNEQHRAIHATLIKQS